MFGEGSDRLIYLSGEVLCMVVGVDILDQVNSAVMEAAPQLVLAGVVLIVSGLCIRFITIRFDAWVKAGMDAEKDAEILMLSVRVGLWFVVLLAVLSVLGFSELATAFGTSSGFLALAVSYVMKDAIKEAVAGFYLMRDEDYFVGAMVTVDGVSGEIVDTRIQRTKIRTDEGDIVTISNQKIEPKWLRESEGL